MTTLLEDKLMQDFVEKSSDQIVKIVKPLNARIASLEAERERLRKCIVDFVDNCLRDEKECPYCREAAALVRGEVKNG